MVWSFFSNYPFSKRAIDFILRYNILDRPAHRGASSGDSRRRSRMRRPRARLVTSLPGGVGAPPGWPLRAACQELADDPGLGRKRGPTPEEERRGEAPKGAPASVIGRRSLPLKGSARPRGGPRGAALRTSDFRRFTPLVFEGAGREGLSPAPSAKNCSRRAAEHWLDDMTWISACGVFRNVRQQRVSLLRRNCGAVHCAAARPACRERAWNSVPKPGRVSGTINTFAHAAHPPHPFFCAAPPPSPLPASGARAHQRAPSFLTQLAVRRDTRGNVHLSIPARKA